MELIHHQFPEKAVSYIDSSNGIRLCTFPLRWLTIRRNPTWQQDQESMVDLVEPAHRYYFSTPEIGFKAFWEPKLSDRYQDDLWQIRDDKILTPLQWPPCCRCCHIVCLIPEYCNCFSSTLCIMLNRMLKKMWWYNLFQALPTSAWPSTDPPLASHSR